MSRLIVSCARCGARRQTNESRASTGLCLDCYRVEPNWPNVTIPKPKRPIARFYPEHGDEVIRAINAIALEVAAKVAKRTEVCACGCLILRDETCPNCALDALSGGLGCRGLAGGVVSQPERPICDRIGAQVKTAPAARQRCDSGASPTGLESTR